MNAALLQDWLQTGVRHHQAGRWDEAAKWYGRVRRALPRNFDAVHLDGTRALQQSRFEEAEQLLTVARRLSPRSAICVMRLGIAQYQLGRLPESLVTLREAVKLDAQLPEAPFHLGQALRRGGQRDEAVAAFERAIALNPHYAEAHDRLGALLAGYRGHAASEPHFRRATELDPTLTASWCNLGISLIFLGRLSEALTALGRALQLNPRFDHAYAARGLALIKCYRNEAAVEAYSRCLEINPANPEAHSSRLLTLQYLGTLSRSALLAEHRRFALAVESQVAPAVVVPADRSPDRPLRVGFLSPDLHRHSVAYFLEPLLAHLDRTQFSVFLYQDQAKQDEMSDRLRALASGWKNVAGLPADALEAMLRADQLDVLIDLAGHTGMNRLPLYARRLAPVQATYLGYPGTTGLTAMDYRLVDPVTDPEGTAEADCTERLIRFASAGWSYQPPAAELAPAPAPASTGADVVFGSFNNFAKITDETLRIWSELLASVDRSRLMLKGHGFSVGALQGELYRRFRVAGIEPDRIILAERTKSVEDHLAVYGQVDVALDSFPYHGTTTTCEALWMGVPVVTRAGETHASRVGASLLTAIGRPEWIAPDWNGYLAIARRLAAEAAASSGPRTGLREALRQSVLMDHPGQAARFGAALRQMWREKGAA
jgi:predicted O-linked N-acetylglucosamine transferase (SPINDLY family)